MSTLRRLGIDEIALRKGHKEFVVVLVDLDSHQLIGMAPSRKHADIKAVLLPWGAEVLARIEEVSIDLSGNYRGFVRRLMPAADIVADRFHVQATLDLLDWMADAQSLYKGAVGTMTRWFGEIVQYFEHRTTSGVVEGINNKLKLIKRSGYGFKNFERFRLRCLICWHFSECPA